jgi:hypothetical protein
MGQFGGIKSCRDEHFTFLPETPMAILWYIDFLPFNLRVYSMGTMQHRYQSSQMTLKNSLHFMRLKIAQEKIKFFKYFKPASPFKKHFTF